MNSLTNKHMHNSRGKKLTFPTPSVLPLLYKMQIPKGLSWWHTPTILATLEDEAGGHQV